MYDGGGSEGLGTEGDRSPPVNSKGKTPTGGSSEAEAFLLMNAYIFMFWKKQKKTIRTTTKNSISNKQGRLKGGQAQAQAPLIRPC